MSVTATSYSFANSAGSFHGIRESDWELAELRFLTRNVKNWQVLSTLADCGEKAVNSFCQQAESQGSTHERRWSIDPLILSIAIVALKS